jgi:hypothetical protein
MPGGRRGPPARDRGGKPRRARATAPVDPERERVVGYSATAVHWAARGPPRVPRPGRRHGAAIRPSVIRALTRRCSGRALGGRIQMKARSYSRPVNGCPILRCRPQLSLSVSAPETMPRTWVCGVAIGAPRLAWLEGPHRCPLARVARERSGERERPRRPAVIARQSLGGPLRHVAGPAVASFGSVAGRPAPGVDTGRRSSAR